VRKNVREEEEEEEKKISVSRHTKKKLNQQQPRGATYRPPIETKRCFARGATEEAEEDRV